MKFSRRKNRYRWSTIGGRKTRPSGSRFRPSARTAIMALIAIIVLGGLAAGVYFLFFKQDEPGSGLTAAADTPALTEQPTPTPFSTPEPTPPPGFNEYYAIDVSAGAQRIAFPNPDDQRNINNPGLNGDELLFSAGKGTISEPVLKTLYHFNITTGEIATVTQSRVSNGELYETLINDRWMIWLDTDQQGTHRIYYLDRTAPPAEDGGADIRQIKECKNAVPKLRLYGDTLIWTEQTDEKEDMVFEVNLVSGEDLSVAKLSDAATYGVSAPSIFENEVIWAAPDPAQAGEGAEELSAVYKAHLDRPHNLADDVLLGMTDDELLAMLSNMDPFETEHESMGMYVHEPIQNADALVWLDANKAPDSTLYLRYNGETLPIANGVTSYQLSDSFLVYGHSQSVFAYFYKTQTYMRLSPEGEKAILPVASGNRVVWFGPSDSSRDTLMTIVLEDR